MSTRALRFDDEDVLFVGYDETDPLTLGYKSRILDKTEDPSDSAKRCGIDDRTGHDTPSDESSISGASYVGDEMFTILSIETSLYAEIAATNRTLPGQTVEIEKSQMSLGLSLPTGGRGQQPHTQLHIEHYEGPLYGGMIDHHASHKTRKKNVKKTKFRR